MLIQQTYSLNRTQCTHLQHAQHLQHLPCNKLEVNHLSNGRCVEALNFKCSPMRYTLAHHTSTL